MLANLITQIACNFFPPATTNAPVWPSLPHFHISPQIQYVHRQMHKHLLFFVFKQLTKSLSISIFNQTRKLYCFLPHCSWGNFSLLTPLITFVTHRHHTLLLYPHKPQASLHRHAQGTCSVINCCSTCKDKGTCYMHHTPSCSLQTLQENIACRVFCCKQIHPCSTGSVYYSGKSRSHSLPYLSLFC